MQSNTHTQTELLRSELDREQSFESNYSIDMQLGAVIKPVLGMQNDNNNKNKNGFANRHISGVDAVCLRVITHQPGCGIFLEQDGLCYSVRICYTAFRHRWAYLIWVPFLRKDVSNECLLHFFLLYQKLPEPLHRQRGRVAGPEINTALPTFNTNCSLRQNIKNTQRKWHSSKKSQI